MTDELQTQYDDAVFAYTTGDYVSAAAGFAAVLAAEPTHFEAQLSLGMAYYRMEDFARALEEGAHLGRVRRDVVVDGLAGQRVVHELGVGAR